MQWFRGGPVSPQEWGGASYRQNTIYLHVVEWTCDRIRFENHFGKIQNVRLLTGGQVSLREDGSHVTLEVAPQYRHPYDTILELTFSEPIVWDGVQG